MGNNTERVRYSTTLDEETLQDLDLIRIELKLDSKNDVIEFLTANYRGKEYVQYKNKKRKSRTSKDTSK